MQYHQKMDKKEPDPELVRRILMLDKDAKLLNGSGYQIKVRGRRISLWPLSDTFYSHSKRLYGFGIENLLTKIQSWMEKDYL